MNDQTTTGMLQAIAAALDLPDDALSRVTFTGTEQLPSCYQVTDLAAASIAAANLALSDLIGRISNAPRLTVDRRLASLWFGFSIRPDGWQIPPPWDAIAGDYRTQTGWIKLHTNAPHHKQAALNVLKCSANRTSVASAVVGWDSDALEQAIVTAGGCAAGMRTEEEWSTHPQGAAVASEPLIIWGDVPGTASKTWTPTPDRPLAGLKVLDLTRVLAGPVATRFLAGYGADVLRIDPPAWDEPGIIPEVTLGKRCARLDLQAAADRRIFEGLLRGADVIVHGYRVDALERLGYGFPIRQSIKPGLIDISLNAYGHSGPWTKRRGFDSLVQLSSGIAASGMIWRGSEVPVSLPVQALDHATGYLIAAATIRSISERLDGGRRLAARLSLARTSKLLCTHRGEPIEGAFAPARQEDFCGDEEKTSWGLARRVKPPCSIEGLPMRWDRPAASLGSSAATWVP